MRLNPAWTIHVETEDEPRPEDVAQFALRGGYISSKCQNYARISITPHGKSMHSTCIVVQPSGGDNRCYFTPAQLYKAFFSDQIYKELAYDELAKQVRDVPTRPPKAAKARQAEASRQHDSYKQLHRHLGPPKRIHRHRSLPE